MNSDYINYVPQSQRYLYPNYTHEQIINSINTSNVIINPSQTSQKNNSPLSIQMNPIQSEITQIQIQNNTSQDQVFLSNPNNLITSLIKPPNNLVNKNSITQKERKDEALHGHPPIPLNITKEAVKSICKISYRYNNIITLGTGFFMKYSDNLKLLITNYHIIYPALINSNIEIEIWNCKRITFNLKGRYVKFLEKPRDITAIEIKTTDEIYKDIQFLNYDLNYKLHGYNIYNNAFIFSIEHPLGADASAASGKIIDIYNFQFDHDISTDNGSSGSPIILLDSMMVIGIHKNKASNNVNGGTFIGEIINEIASEPELESNNYKNNNYIIGQINIDDYNVNKKIRIINSYEEVKRNNNWMKFEDKLKNDTQIKECKIEINNVLIPFNYFNEFKQKGKYIIKYKFKNNLTKTNYMFYECKSLTNLNLSNFNTLYIENMLGMFSGCESLTNLNLSNFNTQYVENMLGMFWGCKSLTYIDLSNFNTQSVTNMQFMFYGCKSLTNLNLSNFNTQNLINMGFMFSGCESLININLSNFNTQNVINMGSLFSGCKSLTNLNLSHFNTQNVKNMGCIFSGCESLTILNLSHFNTQNAINMKFMFNECKSLKKEKVITNDSKIIEELNKIKNI